MSATSQLLRIKDCGNFSGTSSAVGSELQLLPLQHVLSPVSTVAFVMLRVGLVDAQQESLDPIGTTDLILSDWQPWFFVHISHVPYWGNLFI
jgi:hypothetical protein